MSDYDWIKLHRKTLDNPVVMKDSAHLAIWIYLLCNAVWKPVDVIFGGKRVTLQPGQLTTGRKEIAEKLKISESKVQRVLKLFENEHQIEQQTNNKCRLVSIVNWGEYQNSEQQAEQQVNNKRTTSEQQLNTKEEYKNNKKEKKGKNIYIGERYGEFENVFLTDDEYTKLVERFPMDYQERIENLSTYLKQTGKRYKSHYATILSWDRKDKRQTAKTMSKGESEMKAFYGMAEEWAKES